ncbi:MAG TPA: hypothetical protein VJT71_12425 [Pyrinomonadaceae bacterium]|nr:hypothetical protein [Pyrinomonadaceae bacterium]
MLRTKLGISVLAIMTAVALLHPPASAHFPARALRVKSARQTNPSIDTFWTKFKSAVIAGDKSAVATMTLFPIGMPYGVPSVRNRSQLLRRYREVFNTQTDAPKCFADAQPTIIPTDKTRFTVGCKDSAGNEVVEYGFVKTRAGWKFKSLDNINE